MDESPPVLLRRKSGESTESYLDRVQAELPAFPAEVVRDWFQLHGTGVLENTFYLDHRKLRFTRQDWPTCRFEDVTASNMDAVAAWRDMFAEGDWGHRIEGSLGDYMLQNGTWPVPPSILVGEARLVGNLKVGLLHLLEGHHRLAYLLALVNLSHGRLRSHHHVWEVQEAE